MTDSTTPLSAEERAELEQLRAEKARREEEERARAERAELEQLRAQRQAPSAPSSAADRIVAELEKPAVDPENLTFGQKMVMTRDEEDDDGIPPMPPAQKLIIAVCIVAVLAALAWIVLDNFA